MDLIGKKYIFLSISGILMAVALAALGLWGLRPGIDFTGGSLLEVEFSPARPAVGDINRVLADAGDGTILVQPVGERGALLRFKAVDEEMHQLIFSRLKDLSGREAGGSVIENRFDSIGPTIGEELKRRALYAILLSILGIVLYVAWAFRKVSKPVASWKYGMVTVVALVHDVLLPLGAFSFLGHFKGIEVDALFISALLTILGFSVHDTIVVFDRIRENLRKLKQPESYEITVNRSINETIVRSINTSLTVLIVLMAVFFLGGETTKLFAFALILGIIFGTYSSIFVASPLLAIWEQVRRKNR